MFEAVTSKFMNILLVLMLAVLIQVNNGLNNLRIPSEYDSHRNLIHRRIPRITNFDNSGKWVPVQRWNPSRFINSRQIPLDPFSTRIHNRKSRPSASKSLHIRPSQPEFPVYPPNRFNHRFFNQQHQPIGSESVTTFSSEKRNPPPGYLPVPPEQSLHHKDDESELRFLFHRPEDEQLIKSTIIDESKRYNEDVRFIKGPQLKFHRKQTIYLPPKKKSVIYILLKEPIVQTDVEVLDPPNFDATPEVNIVYEKGGQVITKHYHPVLDDQKFHQTNKIEALAPNSRHLQELQINPSESLKFPIDRNHVNNSTNFFKRSLPSIGRNLTRVTASQTVLPNVSSLLDRRNPCQSSLSSKKIQIRSEGLR